VSDVTVYHNPGCSKSRGALEILDDKKVETEVIRYLDAPLARADFERILDILIDPPADLVRKDKKFAELGLAEADYQTREQVIELLLVHPVLMQRPIVIRDGKALIARPSERVLELL
jgi:arsenate reductase (glutaredoxin)